MSGEMEALETLEAAFKAQLSDEWHVERSLTFAGITPDLLLVHPERGVVLVGLMRVRKGFDFAQYDKERKLRAEGILAEGNDDFVANESVDGPGWSGLADPRDVLLDWHSELEGFFGGMIAKDLSRLLRSVLVVIQDDEPVESDVVLGNMSKSQRQALKVEWQRKDISAMSRDEISSLVSRLIPQALAFDKPMPPFVWTRIKREVLGIEDAVLGMAPPSDFRFDRKQQGILDYLSSPGMKRFQGPAGAGKTLMVARVVADRVKADQRVLVVVYNKTMCQMIATRALFFLNEGVTDSAKRISNTRRFNAKVFIAWQDKWWERVCVATDLRRERSMVYSKYFNKGNEGRIATEAEMASLTRRGLLKTKDEKLRYDLVVADEAQNMFPDNWEGLKLSTREESGTVAISSDPTQSLYGSRPWTEQRMKGFSNNPWRKLNATYRLPDDYLKFVADFVSRFPPDEEVNLPALPDQPSLAGSTLYRVASKTEFPKDGIIAAVDFALNILKFSPHQIAVLVPTNNRGKAILQGLRTDRGLNVSHTFEESLRESFGTDDGLRATTFHGYAGWESPCVIVDTNFSEKQTSSNGLLYSGLTRLAKRDHGSAMIFVEGDNQYRDIIREYCEEIKY